MNNVQNFMLIMGNPRSVRGLDSSTVRDFGLQLGVSYDKIESAVLGLSELRTEEANALIDAGLVARH